MNEQTELLHIEWKTLGSQWVATQDHWNDQETVKFERDCWCECENVSRMLLQAMEELDNKVEEAVRSI